MFEALGAFFQAWQTVVHISQWTGLSIGALAALVAIIWFVPDLRLTAAVCAAGVAIAYLAVIYGDRVGRADVTAEWDMANAEALAAAADRDKQVRADLEALYRGALNELTFNLDTKSKELDDALKALPHDVCVLGGAALQLRGHHAPNGANLKDQHSEHLRALATNR